MDSIILIIVAILSVLGSYLLGKKLVPFLLKLKCGQTIKDIGPSWHEKKQGTPTMGGFLIIFGVIISVMVGIVAVYISDSSLGSGQLIKLLSSIIMALCFAFVGFLDDYIKVVKKQNQGLLARQKIFLQVLITIGYLSTLYLSGTTSTIVNIPFIGQMQFGAFYYVFMALLIIGIVNAVNLTDGIDGLASGVTFVFAICFVILASLLNNISVQILAVAVAGANIGFLMWNIHPAKVFMGDTGSMFLGGIVVALAFCLNNPLYLILVGIIYCIEALSVILQVISFKLTGKRIFKMSPIHHHFEMVGWSENKIVSVFCIVTAIGGAAAVIATGLIM